jgi:hypothetical protein
MFDDQPVDFRRLVPSGLTWLLTAASHQIPGPPSSDVVAAQAFAGTALAAGSNNGR